jgi:hypothetical protein
MRHHFGQNFGSVAQGGATEPKIRSGKPWSTVAQQGGSGDGAFFTGCVLGTFEKIENK